MFIGHFAVGFAGKKFAPRTSVALLIAAAQFSDLLWPIFLLLGWEHVRIAPGDTRYTPLDLYDFPWSHSLLMVAVWATAFALVYYALTKYSRGSMIIWICVVSHFLLDWISHRPDMPLYPGAAQRYGLGLWNSIPGTMIVEFAMLAIGVWLYLRTTRARDGIGRYAFAAYIFLLLLIDVGDRFSPPPNSVAELAWTGVIASPILILWAWWFDRHRFVA